MAGQSGVIPDSRLREINQALGAILQAKTEIERATRCGYDGSQDLAECEAYQASLEAWKREYFPVKLPG